MSLLSLPALLTTIIAGCFVHNYTAMVETNLLPWIPSAAFTTPCTPLFNKMSTDSFFYFHFRFPELQLVKITIWWATKCIKSEKWSEITNSSDNIVKLATLLHALMLKPHNSPRLSTQLAPKA